MKRLWYERNGSAADVIQLEDVPDPHASQGEVVVALEAAPVHIADLKAIEGALAFIPAGPGVPGFEGVGRIVERAADVADWQVGDRVILPMSVGAWQELRALPARELWRAPLDRPAEQLALVRINLTTAWLLLHAFISLRPGDWIIQNAANSNVAHYLAAFASHLGIGVVDVVRRAELIAPLVAQGRRMVLADGAQLCGRLGSIIPRLAFDAIGGEATIRMGSCVGEEGLVVAYGFLAEQPYQLAYQDAMFRGVRLEAMMIDRSIKRIGADGVARMEQDIQRFLVDQPLDAQIAAIYPFADAAQALRHAARTGSSRAGKIVLKP